MFIFIIKKYIHLKKDQIDLIWKMRERHFREVG